MSIYFKFSVGRAGTSGANARYITREPATKGDEKAVFTHNYPEYAAEGEQYKECRDNIVAYARQQEEDELRRPRRGTGEARTHYRAVASFEGKVETEEARRMGQEYLEKQFPDARAVGVVHQDTEHTHIHFHIQGRDVNGGKLRFERGQWQQLDREWVRIYGREFGREQEREHLQKKTETREWKQAKARGEERPEPERIRRNDLALHKRREGRNAGREFIEGRDGTDQRAASDGINRREGREQEAVSRQQETSTEERAIDQFAEASRRADQQLDRTQSAARGTLQEVEGVRDEFKELGREVSREIEMEEGRER